MVVLAISAIPAWFYRHKINYAVCQWVVGQIERKSGAEITYTSITVDRHSFSAKNFTMSGKDFKMTAKTVAIDYDWAILWRSSKLRYLRDLYVNDFNVVVTKDITKLSKPDKGESDLKRRKRRLLLNEVLGHFHSLVSLNRGRVTLNIGGQDNVIEITQASLSRFTADNSLLFKLDTAGGGLFPDSSIAGTFSPSIPGNFKAAASVNMFFYGNQWQWHTLNLEGNWDFEGVLTLDMYAAAGDDTKITAAYQTNFLEDDLREFDLNASNLIITRLPAANQVYLSDELMEVLGPNADKIFTRNRITGTFGTDLSIVWDPMSEKAQYDLNIDVNDADMTYHSFPYRAKSLKGFVRIDNSRLKVELESTSGTMLDVKVSAGLGEEDDIDVRVTSPFLPVDNNLYQAIGEVGQAVWLSFAPTGNVAIDYHLFGSRGGDKFQLEINSLGCTICYEEFIYPMYDVRGKLTIADDRILLENMSGSHGKGKVVLNGRIDDQGTSDMKIDLNFDCTDVALDKLLFGALPLEARDGLDDIAITGGAADMKVRVTSAGRGKLAYMVDMDARADALTHIPHNITLDNARVKAVFVDKSVELKSVSGFINGQAVELKGAILADADSKQTRYDIEFEAQDADLEKLAAVFKDAVPKAVRLTGAADVAGYIKGQTGGDEKFAASLRCKSAAFEFVEHGIRLDELNGTIDIDNVSVNYDITAKMADSVNCRVASKGTLDAMNLSNGVANLEITGAKSSDGFIPDELPLSGQGNIDARLDNIIMTDGGISCDKVVMSFSNLEIDGDVLSELNGSVYGGLTYDGGGGLTVSNARLNIDSGKVYDRLVERLIANFKYDPQAGFQMSNDLIAKVCGGDVSGGFKYKPNGAAGSYELSLDFYDVDVNRFVTSDVDDVLGSQFNLDGRASGHLYIKGIPGDNLSRVGRFGFDMKNIEVRDKTLAYKILDALLGKDSAHSMQRLQVDAYLRQDKILIEEVNMLLPIMAMKGSGTIELPTRNINLLLTAQGLGADIRNPFSDLSFFKAIGKTIAKVEVTGDILDPKVEVTTLGLLKR